MQPLRTYMASLYLYLKRILTRDSARKTFTGNGFSLEDLINIDNEAKRLGLIPSINPPKAECIGLGEYADNPDVYDEEMLSLINNPEKYFKL